MTTFFKTRDAAVDRLMDCGFDLDATGNFRRGNRCAFVRQTKRGFVLDLFTTWIGNHFAASWDAARLAPAG